MKEQPCTKPKQPKLRRKHHDHIYLPLRFYDCLSRVHLTAQALRELDRRNHHKPSRRTAVPQIDTAKKGDEELVRIAKRGGPNLCHLRGVLFSNVQYFLCLLPPTNRFVQYHSMESVTYSMPFDAEGNIMERPSPFDDNFEQNCKDNQIFPPRYYLPDGTRAPRPANLDAITEALKGRRRSVSLSFMSKEAFEDFKDEVRGEYHRPLWRHAIPTITGKSSIPNTGDLSFKNLASLTKNTTVKPCPGFFDGAHPDTVDKEVREDLDMIIVPIKPKWNSVPLAPNFFLEAIPYGGSFFIGQRKIMLDGAHGSVIMHTLQNYLLDKPVYDGNAYTFSALLSDEVLWLYAHHLAVPAAPGHNPCLYTTLITAHVMKTKDYLEGIIAFRNLRELAKTYRDQFIETANARSRARS